MDKRVMMVGKAGDVIPWGRESNLLLLAPTSVCGLLIPKWWPKPLVHRYLGMEKQELDAYSAQQHSFVEEARLIVQETMNNLLNMIKPADESEEIVTISSSEDTCFDMDLGLELSN